MGNPDTSSEPCFAGILLHWSVKFFVCRTLLVPSQFIHLECWGGDLEIDKYYVEIYFSTSATNTSLVSLLVIVWY